MALISKIKNTADSIDYNIRDDVHTWGGRNLIWNTIHPVTNYWATTRASIDGEFLKITPTTSAGYVKSKTTYLDYIDTINKTYTISVEAKQSDDTSSYTTAPNLFLYSGYSVSTRTGNIFSTSYDRYSSQITLASTVPTEWTKYSLTFTATDDYFTLGQATALVAGSQLAIEFGVNGSRKPVLLRNIKLEIGNKPTDWSPAPEDIAYVNGTTLELLS